MTADTRSPTWAAITISSLLVVLAAVGLAASSSPSICARCHADQSKALADSPHRRVSCYECHLPAGRWSFAEAKTRELLSMYPKQLLGRGLRGPGEHISRSACVRCHENALAGVVEGGGLRVAHADCAGPPGKCDVCHADTAHGDALRWPRKPDMDVCTACHVDKDVSVRCELCHAGEVPSDVQASGSMKVTHGSDWERTHGMADLRTCVTCHEQSMCVRCHGTVIPHPESFLASHGKEALKAQARCSACHTDQSMCTYCHGIAMPHPSGFRREHMKVARSRKDPACLRCHRDFDCLNCHSGHAHPGTTDGWLAKKRLPKVEGQP